jgi:GNAT superfamily N-acetyltransferase
VNDLGEFSCAVSGYEGFESEILRLRNANRARPESLEYVRWRYRHSPDAPAPLIFWLLSPERLRIGMASVVFRPYWIDGARVQTAVLGDISLDERWRGRGLGLRLVRYMTEHLDRNFPELPGFVIPTEAARRPLAGAGWVTAGDLRPHVCPLNLMRHLRRLVRSHWLALQLARALRALLRVWVRRYVPQDAFVQVEESLDPTVLQFVRGNGGSGRAMRDLDPGSLEWRYAQHPRTRFMYATLTRAGEVRGFLVFEESTLERTCTIYDLAGRTGADLRAMLALWVLRGLSQRHLETLRVWVNDQHPCRVHLRRLGFVTRRPDAVFQVHSVRAAPGLLAWSITQGDKDT